MLTTPHLLVGGAIGTAIGPEHPLIAVTVAAASHFVLDGIPHLMGFIEVEDLDKKDVLFVAGDVLLGVSLLVFLSLGNPEWKMLWLGAIAAFLPDFHHLVQVLFGPEALKRYDQLHLRFHYKKPLRIIPGMATQIATIVAAVTLIWYQK